MKMTKFNLVIQRKDQQAPQASKVHQVQPVHQVLVVAMVIQADQAHLVLQVHQGQLVKV